MWWGQHCLGRVQFQAPCVPQVERGTESRSLGKVRHPPVILFGVGAPSLGGAGRLQMFGGEHRCVWDFGTQVDASPCASGGGRSTWGRGGGWLSFVFLGQGVKTNASVPLTLSFSPVPGDPQVNQSPSPSKCWCIFFGARSELGAVPPCCGVGATG